MTGMMSEVQAEAFRRAAEKLGRSIESLIPTEWREEIQRRGYIGARCGWYPEKPKRRRKARA